MRRKHILRARRPEPVAKPRIGMTTARKAPRCHPGGARGCHTIHAVFEYDTFVGPGTDLFGCVQKQVRRRLSIGHEV